MTYSKAHQNFSDLLQKPEALTAPQDFLGPNYQTVLNFWTFMESLSEDNWNEVSRRYDALDTAARLAARCAAWEAARYAAGYAAWDAAGAAARVAARLAAGYAAWDAAGYATYELMGMHTLLNDGKTLLFIPLFNDL